MSDDEEIFYMDEEIFYEKQKNIIDNIKNKYKIYKCNISDIDVGDNIIVEYISDSQRYINNLFPKYGKIINKKNNSLSNIILENKYNIYNATHEPVSNYSDGFFVIIYKYD